MFKNMNEILKDGKCGEFELEHFEIKSDDIFALFHKMPCGKFVRLLRNGEVVMSNTEMEQRTNANFIDKAHGKVLIGGLGIGMILLAIQDKLEVESITVLEKYNEVIQLVGKQLPLNNKVKIIQADVYNYVPEEFYDVIYMDIWDYINPSIYYNQMVPLMEKYQEFLVPKEKSFVDCWCRKEAMYGEKI